MFKKFLFSLFFFIIALSMFKAYAFIGKNKTESTPFQKDVTYNVSAVSENDFNDDIDIQATSSPFTTLTFFAN